MSANISLNNILIGQTASTLAGRPSRQQCSPGLVTNKSITEEEYIHQMIKSVDKLGPYIVLMPGFALALTLHPEDFVLHTRTYQSQHSENRLISHRENGPGVSVV
ncbi:MAG: hypothetical protein ACLR0U_00650 [Enterocloster clostridioformis]